MNTKLVGGDMRQALEALGLSIYADTLIDTGGYDTTDVLRHLSPPELEAIADDAAMKPGHKLKFIQAFSDTTAQSNAMLTTTGQPQGQAGMPSIEPEVMNRSMAPLDVSTGAETTAHHFLDTRTGQLNVFDSSKAERNYRAEFSLKIGANSLIRCCYLNCEGTPANGDLPIFDPSKFGGRISKLEYDQLRFELIRAYRGNFLSDGCVSSCWCCCLCYICAVSEESCCRDGKVTALLERYNADFLKQKRGISLTYASRLRVDCTAAAHKLDVKIVPI